MRKSKLSNGEPMLVFKIESFVTVRDFSTALTDYYYGESKDFDIKLTKREAVKILKRQLFFYGIQGEHHPGFFEASFELGEIYNSIYDQAREWVQKKYPYLIQEEKE